MLIGARLKSRITLQILSGTPAAYNSTMSSDSIAKRKPPSSDGTIRKKQAKKVPAAANPSTEAGQANGRGVPLVHPKRIQPLKAGSPGSGPVIYWMSRDQRMADNWALIHAAETAVKAGSPVAVAFNLVRMPITTLNEVGKPLALVMYHIMMRSEGHI